MNKIFNKIILLSICCLVFSFASMGNSADKKVFVGALIYGSHNVDTLIGFKGGMKDAGFVEGKNIHYYFDGPYKNKKDLDSGIKELLAHKLDIIFAATTPATIAAKKATRKNKIPIIFGPVNDPVAAGILKELKRPGDNITGVRLTRSTAKQLEWMLRIAPRIKNILVPYNPNDRSSMISKQEIEKANKVLKVNLNFRQVRNNQEIETLIADFPTKAQGIFLPRDGMIMSRIEDFAGLAQRNKCVLTGTRYEMAKKGALFGFGFNGLEIGKQMARLAIQILRGTKPGDLPVETAEDYLSINLKAANTIGITISEHILRQAHIIIR